MSFISYAQNYEDVMLWRALKHVDQGFYIDVGANDPDTDSVTKLFYEHGWRGINIEPVSEWFEKLEKYRARDVNLQLAMGAAAGQTVLYELPETGLSTTDIAIAERHERERNYTKIKREVSVSTLTYICKKYRIKPIHFLKIDVEGAEKSVLEGVDLRQIRPWIIVIESTLPNTQIEDYDLWESELLDAEYVCVYFDGLNRYYLAYEHKKLAIHFQAPPNVFDDFITHKELTSNIRAEVAEKKEQSGEERIETLEVTLSEFKLGNSKLSSKIETLTDEVETLTDEVETLTDEAGTLTDKVGTLTDKVEQFSQLNGDLDRELARVYASKSWRIMLQLRTIMHGVIRWLKLFKL